MIQLRVIQEKPVREPSGPPVPCMECGWCCGYVSMPAHAPNDADAAGDLLWMLYHENVSVATYEEDGGWLWEVNFHTKCRNLTSDRRCAIYERRPETCRDYSEKTCEVNVNYPTVWFRNGADLMTWLRKNRERVWRAMEGKVPHDTWMGKGLL